MTKALPAALIGLLALTACTTRRIEPPPSAAILEARAKASAAKTAKVDRCGLYTFATAAPVMITFPYGATEPSEEASGQIDRLAVWLDCHRDVWVNVTGSPDNTGTPAAQKALADARAAAVTRRLTAAGLHPQRILAFKPPAGATLVLEAKGRGW
jgi:outer membrane protein OmpA-like peptidoglycan-associated protein